MIDPDSTQRIYTTRSAWTEFPFKLSMGILEINPIYQAISDDSIMQEHIDLRFEILNDQIINTAGIKIIDGSKVLIYPKKITQTPKV